MTHKSPFERAKELTSQISSIVSYIDVDALPTAERQAIVAVKQQAVDVRLDVRDYDFAATRAEQLQSASEAKERLEQLRADIIIASSYNLFGAADVAHLSAQVDTLVALLD